MPELPEVETVVRELKSLEGRVPTKLKVSWNKTVTPGVTLLRKSMVGQRIQKVWRRGKYILIELESGDIVTIHLRMTGKLIFAPNARDKNYVRLSIELDGKDWVYFVDIRKFGRFDLVKKGEELLPSLGPEPLDPKENFKILGNLKSRREIKKILLDQKVLAGVGNIYADEALFLAGVSPELPGAEINPVSAKKLANAVSKVLKKSIENMGTTLSDYRNTKNIGGENQNYLRVYGQTGEPCTKCSALIQRVVIGGRSTHFCPKCQKRV